jgi:hypothetical protein
VNQTGYPQDRPIIPNLFAVFAFGLIGAFLLGLLGMFLAVAIGSLMYAPSPPRSPVGAIWAVVGGFWGAFAGFFAGGLLSLYRQGYGRG